MVDEVNNYFLVTALLLCAFGLLATWFMAGVHPRRPWDALPFVLSPALLMTGLINWDLMAVAFVAGALWAWARDRPVLTGVMIGLGAATKLYPLFLLGPILVVAWRQRRLGAFGAAAGCRRCDLGGGQPARRWLTGPEQWKVFWRFNSERGADLGLGLAGADPPRAHRSRPHTINPWSWALFGAVCVAVALLGLRAPSYAAGGAAGLPGGGRVPAGQQGLLAAVRALAAPAGRARPAALARPADLAGRRAALPARRVDLPRRLAGGGGRRRCARSTTSRSGSGSRPQLYLVAVVVRDVLRPEHDPVGSRTEWPNGRSGARPASTVS